MTRADIQIGDKVFAASLIDNASTQTLLAQLPLKFPCSS